MKHEFDKLIDSYLAQKIGIDTDFLTPALSDGLQQRIQELERDQLMTTAGIGNEVARNTQQQMRGDKIYWLDKSSDNAFEQQFLHRIEQLIVYLNQTCYTGINSYEFHYAVYPEGSFYKRHKDQFKTDANRKFSLISYLNESWSEEDGGKLLVYQNEEVQSVIPHAQTAVFFKSDELEHEVSTAYKSRMSVTGWLKQV
jgi:SM-20-related protein